MIITAVIGMVLAFAITGLLGYTVIPYLHKLKFGQTILDIGPVWHKNKQGTPTMGGVMFIIGVVLAIPTALSIGKILKVLEEGGIIDAFGEETRIVPMIAGIALAIGMAFVGFIDDYIKVVKKRNLGLTAKQKTLLQLLLAAAYLYTLYLGGMTQTRLPFFGYVDISKGFGLIFWPIALIFIYGFTNAVNLTDGVDGLATSVTSVVAIFFAVVAAIMSRYPLACLVSAVFLGGLLGFLLWNRHPAKVFMGDTGSMFLGGMAVALSFMIDMPILLFFAGIVYFWEAISVVIQVTYYKKTKKRIFKMTPIHHHYEMSGWSENKICLVFSLITFIGCSIATALYLI
ncbi:MAG: phospho-N-acetylmuramoyl-pentapeptide-transferase [Clostridia bacterium]|nr:phospho-N-acetylmuramoyl-pentapeptide-transferase [Clostridia bacterium]